MILYDFWAPWCGPCLMMNPVVEQLEKEKPELTVMKVNIDDDTLQISAHFNVRSIPTLLMTDESGQEVARVVGATSLAEIKKQLKL